jgi:tRNA pseudouridine55 synthase
MSIHEKEYEGIIRLGFATDTGDVTGSPLPGARRLESLGTDAEIEAAFQSLRGNIEQVPPMYSAKKSGGRKLYELARRGEEVARAAVPVCIHEFEAIKTTGEWIKNNHDGTIDLKVRVVCSTGTYIRVLAEEFGRRLGVGAHLAELRRTRAGHFSIETAVRLGDLKERLAEESVGTVLLPPDIALPEIPFVHLTDDDVRRARNGLDVRATQGGWSDRERVRMRDEKGDLVAIGTFNAKHQMLHPAVVLAAQNRH